MDSDIVDAVTEWSASPFSGGYEGLRRLADRGFSGAVTQGTLWAFMFNGRLIEIEGDSVSAFDETDGTAYEAPTPALPLLYAMQGHGEKQAQYYTNNKSISEANATLSSGSFTGYIELSENVLSGDYYTVYYGGKSRSVAFVGNSRKLLTDEEAFERADDEVGIYTVYTVDLDVTEIPDPSTNASGASTDGNSTDSSDAEPAVSIETSTDHTDEEPTVSVDTSTDHSEGSTDASAEGLAEGFVADDTEESVDSPKTTEASTSHSEPATSREPSEQPDTNTTSSANGNGERQTAATDGSTAAVAEPATDQPDDEDRFTGEAEWRNAKSIPSLDPSNDPEQEQSQSTAQQSSAKTKKRQSTSGSQLSRKQLQSRLKRAEKIMQKAEEQHERLLQERDDALNELETVQTQLSEAEAEVERLQNQLESSAGSQRSTGSQPMSETDALQGTNLLVRYASKGDSTLEDAATGDASQEDVRSNLRIEPHTTFATEEVTVDGMAFESFLENRIELAFVRWLTEEFLFDIQQTGNQTDLSGIYETIPAINRAELHGTVSLGTDDEGDSIEATFDVVIRDKRDQPLFIANFHESKQPVANGMIDSLVRDGSEIIQRNDSFAGAFAVTTSYYKGEALDAAADATGGSLLSASRGKSFVYISRKQGFHLCLVEKLGDTFDLHVPEL